MFYCKIGVDYPLMDTLISHKNLLDSGLKEEFIAGLDKRYVEFFISKEWKECFFELKNFIYKNEPERFQKKVVSKYIEQTHQNVPLTQTS